MRVLIFCMTILLGVLQGNPTVVAKFGPAECLWSEELKKGIWNASSFQSLLESEGIKREEMKPLEGDTTVPVLTLVTSEGEEIGSLGYLLISPEKYVDLIKEMLVIHSVCRSLTDLNAEELLHLYRKSQVFQMTSCMEKLLQAGLAQDTGVDFLIEHYAQLIKNHPRKAQKVKQEIRARKPHDLAAEWELALLSFQARREKMTHVAKIALPLVKFLRGFKTQGTDYGWRCCLVLAEFYRDKNDLKKARSYAQLAAQEAPSELKEMISTIGKEAL